MAVRIETHQRGHVRGRHEAKTQGAKARNPGSLSLSAREGKGGILDRSTNSKENNSENTPLVAQRIGVERVRELKKSSGGGGKKGVSS